MIPYAYRVVSVKRVVDGDTIDLTLDLGFHLSAALRFRLLGVNTPEVGYPGAEEAAAFVAAWLALPGPLVVHSRKADSFGRWLADVRRDDHPSSLSLLLLDAGLAVPYSR